MSRGQGLSSNHPGPPIDFEYRGQTLAPRWRVDSPKPPAEVPKGLAFTRSRPEPQPQPQRRSPCREAEHPPSHPPLGPLDEGLILMLIVSRVVTERGTLGSEAV